MNEFVSILRKLVNVRNCRILAIRADENCWFDWLSHSFNQPWQRKLFFKLTWKIILLSSACSLHWATVVPALIKAEISLFFLTPIIKYAFFAVRLQAFSWSQTTAAKLILSPATFILRVRVVLQAGQNMWNKFKALATAGMFLLILATPVIAQVCAFPGKDGINTTVSSIVNTYYAGTSTASVILILKKFHFHFHFYFQFDLPFRQS